MATFSKKASGWQASIRKSGYKPQYKTFEKKALAVRWAHDIEREMDEGIFKDNSKAAKLKIHAALERFSAEILPTRRDGGTVEKSKVNLICKYFGKYTLVTLTAEIVMAFVTERKKEVKNDTILKDLAVIFDLFETARILWDIPCVNPMIEVRAQLKKLKSLQPGKGRDRRLERDEYDRLINCVPRYKGGQRKSLIIFAVATAMRREEIARMCWPDFNEAAKTLHIPKAKHGARTIPLSVDAMNVLLELKKLPTRIDGSIWGIKKKSISRLFERLVSQLKIENLHFHDLRHEGTSRLFELGLSIPEVQLITGHCDWRSLQRYTKLQAADVGKKLNALDRSQVVKIPSNVSKIS